MAGKRKYPLWHQVFLRVLARTGNVERAAFEAGVDKATAYNHRRKDVGFAAKWAGALETFKERPSPRPSPRNGRGGKEELVIRRTKHGDKLVRVSPGRWDKRAEDLFFASLGETACVRSAAAACGFSTNALYMRREAYPEFAAKWDRVLVSAKRQIPDMLAAAAIASLDPQAGPGTGRRGYPKVSVDHAIRISAMEQRKAEAAAKGRRGPVDPAEEARKKRELADAINKLCDQIEKRRTPERLAAGWQKSAEGVWIPPGWVRDSSASGGDETPKREPFGFAQDR